MKKNTLSVLIPAYNEGHQISKLVRSVLSQKNDHYTLEKIIVASDGSKDETVSSLLKIKNKKLTVLDYKSRRGKAYRQNQLLNKSNSDIAVIFDADIEIHDSHCIDKLILPIVNGKAEMTSSALEELKSRSFFESVLNVSMKHKRILFAQFKNGRNVYNCHGPSRAFSKSVYKDLHFPQSSGEDMYSYLAVVFMGKRFVYTPKSRVFYCLPSHPNDHYKQSVRYLTAISDMKRYFPEEFVDKEMSIPVRIYIVSALFAIPLIIRYPIHTLLYFGTILVTVVGNKLAIKPQELWGIKTSKLINHVK